ncbi:MAG: HEAT repeat domain-containing protein, partial [Planctomycetota bacterium]
MSSVEAAPPIENPTPPAVAQPDRGAIDALIAELNSPDELIRLRAVVTLGLMGRSADAALPALQQASQDANPDIRAAIARAIDRIQGAPGANAAGPNILRLVDRRATVREKLGPDDARDPVRKTPQKIFSISLQQQRSYVIDLVSTQFDTFLRLENDEGREVAHDDDSGGDLNARLRFVPRTDGVFKIVATAFRPDAAGEFELTVREESSGPVAGGDQLVDLTNGETQIPGAIAGNEPPDLVRKLPCKVYSVRFVRGEAYQIDMTSREIDSFLRLEDADSREVARDDDGGGNLNARIVFEPTETGIYRIVASSFGGQAGAFDVTVRRIRGGGGLVRPGDPKDADQPVVASLVSSRMVLSHGRLDDLRGAGYASPDNPVSQVVPAIANLFRTLAAQPDPRRVTMDLNTTFNGPRDPKLPSPVFLATMDLPSSMTLLVAELGPPALAQSVSHWEQALPRFGNGNFYATVSMPEFGIVAGQELMTQKHFEVYTANSILWEAPDFGNIVMPRNLEGGTTNLGVAIARGKKEKHVVLNVGWANPLELE